MEEHVDSFGNRDPSVALSDCFTMRASQKSSKYYYRDLETNFHKDFLREGSRLIDALSRNCAFTGTDAEGPAYFFELLVWHYSRSTSRAFCFQPSYRFK